mmetsp:Transcript_41207/g.66823  ORF Transcript_41207/g.66823 Transcript_41207/m.66823 type:complete len:227 (+) Transcript_41207:357-1037(+)
MEQELSVVQSWEDRQGMYITSMDVDPEGQVYYAGEDGSVRGFHMSRPQQVDISVDCADSICVHSIRYYGPRSFFTCGTSLKLWVLNQGTSSPSLVLPGSPKQGLFTCIAVHPDRRDQVLVGSSHGDITAYDLRLPSEPLSHIPAHGAAVWEIAHLPSNPEHWYSCSEDGTLLSYSPNSTENSGIDQVFSSDLSINSISLHPDKGTIACASDTGVINLLASGIMSSA